MRDRSPLPYEMSRALMVIFGFSGLLGCGGGASGAGGGTASPALLEVSPSYVRLLPGATQSFSARLNGSADAAVVWSAASGTISSSGLYQAPVATGIFAVRASLASDQATYAEATVEVGTAPVSGACNSADLGPGADLQGFLPFPADNPWNQDISGAPVDADSGNIIAFIGANGGLKTDFGSGTWDGAPIGIPYLVVPSSQAMAPIQYTAYGDESDPGPMPVPGAAPVEGGADATGDRHVLVLDRDNCLLYELYRAFPQPGGGWAADSGTVWDLQSNGLRPLGWTSADAAGLPVFPGLARYDEVAGGEINHALRFTVPTSRRAFLPPATHWASSNTSTSAPPMGMRVRLKASVDISGYPPQARVVLAALKKYGLILADNGSAWFISGAPDPRWDNAQLQALGAIKGSDLEVIRMNGMVTSVPSGAAPLISAFTASPSQVSVGQAVTLSWTATGATRYFVTPEPGLVRGSGATVRPGATTLYTLTAQGPNGTATRQLTVQVN